MGVGGAGADQEIIGDGRHVRDLKELDVQALVVIQDFCRTGGDLFRCIHTVSPFQVRVSFRCQWARAGPIQQAGPIQRAVL